MSSSYTISSLAAAVGVHVETIRYYQRLKLMPEPQTFRGHTAIQMHNRIIAGDVARTVALDPDCQRTKTAQELDEVISGLPV